MLRIPLVSAIVLGVIIATVPGVRAAETVSVRLKGSDTGQTFQGVGAVSAGASTRLLYDYAEPYRSDVLDFLFKPGFGAGFQHLKVEIGGGENSTCGSEPSHAVTRDELAHPKARGYEFWLMREARNRNPRVMLDCLPWCYPGWIRGRFSQDATDWFVAFLEVARKQYGMEVDWVAAAQNENGTDRNWIVKSVRPTLDRKGFGSVKIQAPDCDKQYWAVFDEFEKDPAYRDAVDAVGYHYVNGREPWHIDQVSHRDTTPKAKASGKQLWASEEWSMSGGKWDGTGAMFLARLINKLYIRDRICKTEIWCPIASIYDGAAVVRHGGDAGRYALVGTLRRVAGHLGRGAHDSVRPARLEVPRRRLRADRSQDLERHVRFAEGPADGRLEHDRLHRRPGNAAYFGVRRPEDRTGPRLAVRRAGAVRQARRHPAGPGRSCRPPPRQLHLLADDHDRAAQRHARPCDPRRQALPAPLPRRLRVVPSRARRRVTSPIRRAPSRCATSRATASA